MTEGATLERIHGEGCDCPRCAGFQPGNELALRHGATSERRVAPRAKNYRRRLLRRYGVRARDLDACARTYLDLASRSQAKIEMLDLWFDEHGFVDASGRPAPAAKLYVSLLRQTTTVVQRLEEHLASRSLDPVGALDAYLAAKRASPSTEPTR